jgi:hypothetical protein
MIQSISEPGKNLISKEGLLRICLKLWCITLGLLISWNSFAAITLQITSFIQITIGCTKYCDENLPLSWKLLVSTPKIKFLDIHWVISEIIHANIRLDREARLLHQVFISIHFLHRIHNNGSREPGSVNPSDSSEVYGTPVYQATISAFIFCTVAFPFPISGHRMDVFFHTLRLFSPRNKRRFGKEYK